ncbi:MAG: hypothetical protein AAF360_18150 [Pseudomonadota bacterium]
MLNMIIRAVMRRLMRKAVSRSVDMAINGGRSMMKNRRAGETSGGETSGGEASGGGGAIDQDPAVTGRRRRHADERRGDEILYPTDDYTEPMQPRR